MSIIKQIEDAGARADSIPYFVRELFAAVEARIAELEAVVKALSTPAAPPPPAPPAS